MQILINHQLTIISFATLFLFFIYANCVLEKRSVIRRLYLSAALLNLFLTLSNLLLKILLENYTIPLIVIRIIRCINFIVSPLLAYTFLLFICNYFANPFRIKKQAGLVFNLLFFANTITAIIAFKTDMFINKLGWGAYILPFSISLILLFYSIYVIFNRRKLLLKVEYIYIMSVSLMIVAVTAFQLILNKTGYIWCFNSLVLIFMFIIIQQGELYKDSLTGARNRQALKKCIDCYERRNLSRLSAVMIDLDYFKSINDLYGHSEGDFALKAFVKMLQRVYLNSGIVFRTGGDEFLVLIDNRSEPQIHDLMKKVSGVVEKFNAGGNKPYSIKYSYAFGTYKRTDKGVNQFLHEIDLQMYNNKNGKKRIFGEGLQSGIYAGIL
ncbi:GGDEF domain-containing protein [Clostridium sp. BNL1100]|uniref:GGDEF domain-containing protein n=1 Tax=Clostridium sp. BNL1100 TaxID=755731 RepID=UPI00024A7EDD|nr:GGDEF domain-containing protein [Clostridium sp. BNL1100]AEY64998.1 diguanylate cyclase (GGDEF) domain-containing protein [Clostridium sp. BNL1100]